MSNEGFFDKVKDFLQGHPETPAQAPAESETAPQTSAALETEGTSPEPSRGTAEPDG